MNDKKIVKIGQKQQLFDLNGQLTNFDLNFTVKSLQNKDFYVLVVDQTTLDNDTNLHFRKTENGYIGGNIVNDKNVYQNYFLCLRSDFDDHDVEIFVEKKEIPPKKEENYIQPSAETVKENYNNNKLSVKSCFLNWKIILIIVLVLLAVGYLWYNYKKSSGENNDNMDVNNKLSSPSPSPSIKIDSPFSSPESSQSSDLGVNSSIMDKINKLNVK
jgi:hypothetical protein